MYKEEEEDLFVFIDTKEEPREGEEERARERALGCQLLFITTGPSP